MQTLKLIAYANNTFRWSRSLADYVSVFDLPNCIIRMQIRREHYSALIFEWSTANGKASYASGTVVFLASISEVMSLLGNYKFDIRIETSGGSSDVIIAGEITFEQGVTRISGDGAETATSGVPDTVEIIGQTTTLSVGVIISKLKIALKNAGNGYFDAVEARAELAVDPGGTLYEFWTTGGETRVGDSLYDVIVLATSQAVADAAYEAAKSISL